ncbi:ParB N-terminal domain-containing protein [Streptomyces sp. 110]|uniref:ParB N-terminal domain-containing protein n=1 Tax=Streptomyces endocoffeicus TaxID=2898945 RepID=A0ABS1Q7U1_9ACTN|nr:ParB N-terminal domain-containing protein [Streptomyces endocoffeicus]MBL1120739.1 ParB N-terminal domain-containing protein [Streptomyces endocoffeicus]
MQTTQGIINPLGLDLIDATAYSPFHEVRDEEHRDAIAADMRKHGWRGAPLVVLPTYLLSLTGVHRRSAAELAELEEIPGVSLEDIFEACGMNLWEAINSDEEYMNASSYYDYSRVIADHLPEEVIETYGLDMH